MPLARQLLTIAKVFPGVADDLDQAVSELRGAAGLASLVHASNSGRGLLHWATWLDPWLMGIDLNPDHWALGIGGKSLGPDLWELPLDADWAGVERAMGKKHQYVEQFWLPWQLWQGFTAYQAQNGVSRLLYGRAVVGASLGDTELLERGT